MDVIFIKALVALTTLEKARLFLRDWLIKATRAVEPEEKKKSQLNRTRHKEMLHGSDIGFSVSSMRFTDYHIS